MAERKFHSESYGYQARRSALDAVAACRERCWRTDWAIDLDIQKFFDGVPSDLVVKAVEANTHQMLDEALAGRRWWPTCTPRASYYEETRSGLGEELPEDLDHLTARARQGC